MERDTLLKHLTNLDFMATDLHLFLDTHPHDREALDLYAKVCAAADKHRHMYESKFGPLCASKCADRRKWAWADDPWPWNAEANARQCDEADRGACGEAERSCEYVGL